MVKFVSGLADLYRVAFLHHVFAPRLDGRVILTIGMIAALDDLGRFLAHAVLLWFFPVALKMTHLLLARLANVGYFVFKH